MANDAPNSLAVRLAEGRDAKAGAEGVCAHRVHHQITPNAAAPAAIAATGSAHRPSRARSARRFSHARIAHPKAPPSEPVTAPTGKAPRLPASNPTQKPNSAQKPRLRRSGEPALAAKTGQAAMPISAPSRVANSAPTSPASPMPLQVAPNAAAGPHYKPVLDTVHAAERQ